MNRTVKVASTSVATNNDPMGRSEQAISSFSDAVIYWFRQNFGKIILLIVVAVCAALISKIVAAAMRRALERTNLPLSLIHI